MSKMRSIEGQSKALNAFRSFRRLLPQFVGILIVISVHAEDFEHKLARSIIGDFKENELRLKQIAEELKTLPVPFPREPTGTGGWVSDLDNPINRETALSFSWDESVTIDSIALFPLRLFTDDVYSEYLFWPKSMIFEVEAGDTNKVVARYDGALPLVRQSLPMLIEFDPIQTQKLTIRCTNLGKHPNKKKYAAGFSEIAIFSGQENIAPRAIGTGASEQGYKVLAREFLTDGHTPIGLPELSSYPEVHGFMRRGWGVEPIPSPYYLTCSYNEPVLVNSVRIDPAIKFAYGQSFPVRFTIELLGADGEVLETDNTYAKFPLRAPGLNPYFAYFPETETHAVRLTVFEASQPVPQALRAIAFSEITLIHKGRIQRLADRIDEVFLSKHLHIVRGEPFKTEEFKMIAATNDGHTQAGRVLSQRYWIEGLVQRQKIMDEQVILQTAQQKHLQTITRTLVYGSLSLLVLIVGSTVFYIVRHRIRNHRKIRTMRNQIASDLHDNVGSSLGAIILQIERLQEKIETPLEQVRLATIHRLARESSFGLREVLNATAPEVGRSQDILVHMHELTSLLIGRTDFTFDADPAVKEVLQGHGIRKDILLFYKEALFNAKRHADCSRIEISLHLEEENLVLRIKDNGRGMDQQTLNKPNTLRTLKQRATWLKAELQVESAPETGTALTLIIPG